MPEMPYTVSSPDTAVVSKTGEVKIRKELYHIPGASIRQKVFARVFAYFLSPWGKVLCTTTLALKEGMA